MYNVCNSLTFKQIEYVNLTDMRSLISPHKNIWVLYICVYYCNKKVRWINLHSVYINIGIMVRDRSSIPGRVIKTQKMVLDASLLNTQHYKVWIKCKESNPGKGVAPSPTLRCCSYWKGSLRFANLLTYIISKINPMYVH